MKVTIELTPESVQLLKGWTADLLIQIQNSMIGDKQQFKGGEISQANSKTLTIEEFVADTQMPNQTEQPVKTQSKGYTLETVRAKLAELSRAGKREAVSELIYSYGVKRLTELEPCHYAAVMQKAGEL